MASVASATTGASAIIKDGVITNQVTPEQKAEQEKTQEAKNSASAQKDQFLQLLVAQMKYQDPLEPTSNTEYISQYATFSSLEQMQNMSATMTMSRANDMVGKEVVIHHSGTNGETQEVTGTVDYVTYENNKAKVYVGGQSYDVDEVYAVLGESYKVSGDKADKFQADVDALPSLIDLKAEDAKKVEELANRYDAFDDTTKSLIPSEYTTSMLQYITWCQDRGWISNQRPQTDGTTPATPTENNQAVEEVTPPADTKSEETAEEQVTDTTDRKEATETAASEEEAEALHEVLRDRDGAPIDPDQAAELLTTDQAAAASGAKAAEDEE